MKKFLLLILLFIVGTACADIEEWDGINNYKNKTIVYNTETNIAYVKNVTPKQEFPVLKREPTPSVPPNYIAKKLKSAGTVLNPPKYYYLEKVTIVK